MPRRKNTVLRTIDIFLIVIIALLAAALLIVSAAPKEKPSQPPLYIGYTVTMAVPAVDSQGNGVTADLIVETKKGNGKTLANIDVLLFWVDTQQSIQIARSVAEETTGIDTRSIDLIYSIEAPNVTLVGGPSAGAALTIATIAALQTKQPSPDVMITGTVEEDGSIGQVGGILEKARAVKDAGATVFLVPPGESTETSTRPVETCTKEPGYVYCETVYKRTSINIGQEVGLTVEEISDISQALPYFFQ